MHSTWGVLCACLLLLAANDSHGQDGGRTATRPEGADSTSAPLIDRNDMDTSVRPGDDFFRFANGRWIDRQTIPPEMSVYRAKEIVERARDEEVRTLLDGIIRSPEAALGSARQKLRDLYLSAMDTTAIDRDGVRHLQSDFDAIDRVATPADLQDAIAGLHVSLVNVVFAVSVTVDLKDSNHHSLYLSQSGLGLTNSEDYLDPGEKGGETRAEYVKHIERMLALLGEEPAAAASHARAAMAIETRLAAKHLTRAQQRDLGSQYNKMELAQLVELCPQFDWNRYFDQIDIRPRQIVVTSPDYMKEVGRMLADVSLPEWRAYLRWRVLDSYADCLSDAFVRQNWQFYEAYLSGEEVPRPRDEYAREVVSVLLGDLLGALYVEAYFPPQNKVRLEGIFAGLKGSLGAHIRACDWMSPSTKTAALQKLDAMRIKVGYPEKWRDFSGLRIERDGYLPNHRRIRQHRFQSELARLEQPVDRELWPFPPQTANAGYSVAKNEIIFPAGILRPPVFYAQADDAMNYGSIGFAIAHEMIHGFDDQGRRFDREGNLHDWWAKEDELEFRKRAQVLSDQYGSFVVADTVRLNTRLTLGENIADLGGLSIALDAYHKGVAGQTVLPIDGFTGDQRFFLAFAKFFRGKIREQALLRMVKEDRHPWGAFRVNGTLPNVPEFYSAFNVGPEDRLFRSPEQRPKIW